MGRKNSSSKLTIQVLVSDVKQIATLEKHCLCSWPGGILSCISVLFNTSVEERKLVSITRGWAPAILMDPRFLENPGFQENSDPNLSPRSGPRCPGAIDFLFFSQDMLNLCVILK